MSFLRETWRNFAGDLWKEEAVDKLAEHVATDDPGGSPIFPPPNPHTQYMLWRGEWTQQEYDAHETVRDGEWTMVANKTTTDRPAPQPTAPPDWLSELPDAPAWTDDSDTAGVVFSGQRYTFEAGFLTGIRFWFPVADGNQEYSAWLVEGPTGPSPVVTQLLAKQAPGATGWFEANVPVSLIAGGTIWDVFIAAYSTATPSIDSGPWNYVRGNQDPVATEIRHSNDNITMRISYTDNDLADRTALIQGLGAGDDIDSGLGGVTWAVVRKISDDVGFSTFEVSPAVRAGNGLYTFSFTVIVDALVPSVSITDYYLAPPPAAALSILGLKGIDTIDNIVPDNNAYGVDLRFTPAIISDDWDLVALSEGVASSGVPEDVKFFRDSNDIIITTQADDPITPTNWVTYADFDMDLEQVVSYEFHLRRIWTMDVANRQAYFRTLLDDTEINPGEFQRVEIANAANREFSVDIGVSPLVIDAGVPITINIKFQALVSAGGNPELTIFDSYFLVRSLPSAVEVT